MIFDIYQHGSIAICKRRYSYIRDVCASVHPSDRLQLYMYSVQNGFVIDGEPEHSSFSIYQVHP